MKKYIWITVALIILTSCSSVSKIIGDGLPSESDAKEYYFSKTKKAVNEAFLK